MPIGEDSLLHGELDRRKKSRWKKTWFVLSWLFPILVLVAVFAMWLLNRESIFDVVVLALLSWALGLRLGLHIAED